LGDIPQNSGFIWAVGRFHQAKIFSRLISAMPRSIQKPFHGEIQSLETATSEKLTRKRFPAKIVPNNSRLRDPTQCRGNIAAGGAQIARTDSVMQDLVFLRFWIPDLAAS
jgi:hypothetical protein